MTYQPAFPSEAWTEGDERLQVAVNCHDHGTRMQDGLSVLCSAAGVGESSPQPPRWAPAGSFLARPPDPRTSHARSRQIAADFEVLNQLDQASVKSPGSAQKKSACCLTVAQFCVSSASCLQVSTKPPLWALASCLATARSECPCLRRLNRCRGPEYVEAAHSLCSQHGTSCLRLSGRTGANTARSAWV